VGGFGSPALAESVGMTRVRRGSAFRHEERRVVSILDIDGKCSGTTVVEERASGKEVSAKQRDEPVSNKTSRAGKFESAYVGTGNAKTNCVGLRIMQAAGRPDADVANHRKLQALDDQGIDCTDDCSGIDQSVTVARPLDVERYGFLETDVFLGRV
jgi:hypothetical protein